MGKVAAAEMMKKKKGRPSLSDLRKRNLEQQQQALIPSDPNLETPDRRSTRRNPSLNGISPESDWISGEAGGDDDDDERKEKKVKLVVRLPPFDHPRSSGNSLSLNSASYGSDSNADGEKPKISDLAAADQVEMVQKATDTLQGSLVEFGPTTPLPDKKLLVFILDRLQKKDTYGVFSEPVDLTELPDYCDVIEHPMDFGTLRKKLEEGRYSNLDKFEADVFLICSNAMQYNAPDTVYYRQARTIQELAKRDFENLRQVNDDGEPQPKIVRRGRPPGSGKNMKKSLSSPPVERIGPQSSSEATLATADDNVVGSNSYNLRRAPKSYGFQANDAFFKASYHSYDNETYGDLEWNSEFPASVLKAEAKHVKKQFTVDENKRATYKQFHPSAFGRETSQLAALNGDMKQLMGVGLTSEHGYARSLARFAANLGPVVWKIAAKKIECALPTGVKFGPGWVGENEAPPRLPSALPEQKSLNNFVHDGRPLLTQPVSGTNSAVPYRSSLPCNEEMVEAVSAQTSRKELAVSRSCAGGVIGSGPLQKQVLQNGFNGISGYDFSNQTARVRQPKPAGRTGLEGEASKPSPTLGVVSSSNTPLMTPPMAANRTMSEPKLPASSRSTRYEYVSVAGTTPDLNVRFQSPGSPSSSLQIGSPQHPDLALQL